MSSRLPLFLLPLLTLNAGFIACGGDDNGSSDPDPALDGGDGGKKSGIDGADIEDDAKLPLIDKKTSLLVADVNRNGTIDESDATELAARDTWDDKHGAVFLSNLDDDLVACPIQNQTDDQLNACNDAADAVINGPDDLLDLAEIHVTAWPNMPSGASAKLDIDAKSKATVRLFKKVGTSYEVFSPGSAITSAELKSGLELRIEGKDIVRDSAIWDGYVNLSLALSDGSKSLGVDKLKMRLAPIIVPNHLDEPVAIFASDRGESLSANFLAALTGVTKAVTTKSVPPAIGLPTGDIWAQDYWEPAYTSMPGPKGTVKSLRLNFRSANFATGWAGGKGNSLRPGGRTAYALRGKDVGVLVSYDPTHDDQMDSLNSFGNLETIPPFKNGADSYPLGRVLRGKTSTFYPDPAFNKMIESQKIQAPVYVDSSWLIVGHVDEVFSFIKTNTPRGWGLLLADPAMAKTMYTQVNANGGGATPVHAGTFVFDSKDNQVSSATTVAKVLTNTDVMNTSQAAVARINAMVTVLQTETGLLDSEIIHVPFFFESEGGLGIAFDPGMVNGLSFGEGHFIAPNPHGPVVAGNDILAKAFQDAVAPHGLTIHWVEDWNLLHRNLGEVHCGSNTWRAVPTNNGFWTSGR